MYPSIRTSLHFIGTQTITALPFTVPQRDSSSHVNHTKNDLPCKRLRASSRIDITSQKRNHNSFNCLIINSSEEDQVHTLATHMIHITITTRFPEPTVNTKLSMAVHTLSTLGWSTLTTDLAQLTRHFQDQNLYRNAYKTKRT